MEAFFMCVNDVCEKKNRNTTLVSNLLIILISREFYRKQKINLNLKCTD